MLGVLGGIIAFGFLGLFIGPTLLAVAYTVIREWSHVTEQSPDSGNG
jgi:predicted PurR-regulated permease PerM